MPKLQHEQDEPGGGARAETPSRTVPVVRYAARSKSEEIGKDSVGDQVRLINERVVSAGGGRFFYGEEHIDHASGSKQNRGPRLVAAIEEAERAATEHGHAELWVWRTHRLGRGSGYRGEARAIGKLLYDLREKGVTVRSVTDDEFATNEMLWGFASRQASQYAEDLRANVSRGFRSQAERGIFTGNIVADGLRKLFEYDDAGRKLGSRLVRDPDRWPVVELMLRLALDGWPDAAVAAELDRRGYLTDPKKRGQKPRRFDPTVVSQMVVRPAYAGLMVHRGRVLEGVVGRWPAIITPEQHYEILRLRKTRLNAPNRRAGRPIEGYVLARVARCGVCGSRMDCVPGKVRRDGTRRLAYVCYSHRHLRECEVSPIEAGMVDRAFVANLRNFMGDVEAWRDRLVASRQRDRGRMAVEVERARDDLAAIERVIASGQARWAKALEAGDDDRARLIEDALKAPHAERRQAELRLTAATDALASVGGDVDVDPLLDFFTTLTAKLSGMVEAAGNEVKALNLIVQEFFAAVVLTPEKGGVRIRPVLGEEAFRLIHTEPERFRQRNGLLPVFDDEVEELPVVAADDGRLLDLHGHPFEPPPLLTILADDAKSGFTSQKTIRLSSHATTSSSPHRVL